MRAKLKSMVEIRARSRSPARSSHGMDSRSFLVSSRLQTGVLPRFDHILRATDGDCRVYRHQLPDNQKIIEHPDGRQFLFDRRLRARHLLDVGGYVERPDHVQREPVFGGASEITGNRPVRKPGGCSGSGYLSRIMLCRNLTNRTEWAQRFFLRVCPLPLGSCDSLAGRTPSKGFLHKFFNTSCHSSPLITRRVNFTSAKTVTHSMAMPMLKPKKISMMGIIRLRCHNHFGRQYVTQSVKPAKPTVLVLCSSIQREVHIQRAPDPFTDCCVGLSPIPGSKLHLSLNALSGALLKPFALRHLQVILKKFFG
jgi:hypothetical protein